MVPVLRIVDRTLALSLAFAPLGQLLARPSLGTSGAVLVGGVLSLLIAVLVVLYVPAQDSGDVWRFGVYTFVGFVAAVLVARQVSSVELADSPLLETLAWAIAAAGALYLVDRRRTRTAT